MKVLMIFSSAAKFPLYIFDRSAYKIELLFICLEKLIIEVGVVTSSNTPSPRLISKTRV